LGYEIARQFDLPIVPTTAALVPFTLSEAQLQTLSPLSGIAVEAVMRTDKQAFREGMLFTHRGLSGPAALQISSYWKAGQPITIQMAPDIDIAAFLLDAKETHPKQELATVVGQHFPKRMVQAFIAEHWPTDAPRKMAEIGKKQLMAFARHFTDWSLIPAGTEGYRTAEVTLGGVDTAALSSQTMECARVPGLFFIGEVVDVTGHLGGFNFQWAWASGFAAGQYA
jgi:predicted Rossmann fold flavoprotein